jgi:hypothetical protein
VKFVADFRPKEGKIVLYFLESSFAVGDAWARLLVGDISANSLPRAVAMWNEEWSDLDFWEGKSSR